MAAKKLDESVLKLWEDFRSAYVRERVLSCAQALTERDFTVFPTPTISEANRTILGSINRGRTVYYWDEPTLEELGILETLSARGNPVKSAWELLSKRGSKRGHGMPYGSVYLTSVCAVTMDGELVKVMPEGVPLYPPEASLEGVVIAAGVNKIVSDMGEGFRRAKDICVPHCARRLGLDLPCVGAEQCVECDTPHPMCAVNTVVSRRPSRPEIIVVLIGERLGD